MTSCRVSCRRWQEEGCSRGVLGEFKSRRRRARSALAQLCLSWARGVWRARSISMSSKENELRKRAWVARVPREKTWVSVSIPKNCHPMDRFRALRPGVSIGEAAESVTGTSCNMAAQAEQMDVEGSMSHVAAYLSLLPTTTTMIDARRRDPPPPREQPPFFANTRHDRMHASLPLVYR